MKKMLSIFLCALLLLVPTGCQNAPTDAGAAADLRPGVSDGLEVEIVRPGVDDHGAPEHVLYTEAAGDYRQLGSALAAQQRRQIPGVEGMGAALRIIVPAGVGEALSGAIPLFVDMEGEDF